MSKGGKQAVPTVQISSMEVRPLQKRVSSFGANNNKTVAEARNSGKNRQTKSKLPIDSSTAGSNITKPVKITSKTGYDKEIEKKYDLMLAGDLSDLPHLPRSIVRIFLSSTFSDMRAERNMLAREVYPELRQRCAEVELDFQVVDLRWGLTSETENDHSGTKVCLQEIKNCQDVSLGPNFVGILGHRYGMHRPLVVELPITDFETLLVEARSHDLPDVSLVETWYQKDDNAIPPVYVLQSIRTHYAHYGDMTPGKEEQRSQDLQRWNETQQRLQHVLQTAAKSAFKAKKISEEAWRQHFMSVTDHEIMSGIVQASNTDKHTAFFTRELTGLRGDALTHKMADKYADITLKDGKPCKDTDTEALIAELVNRVKAKLGQDKVISLTTPWKEGGIDPEKFPDHKQYITEFCNHFLNKVTDLITQGMDLRLAKIRQREWYTLYNEALHHMRFTNAKCESFCGQEPVLEKAKAYILDPSLRKPFVIHAPSGAGKTSIMAMIMKKLHTWLPGGHIGIIRFLGTSPQSLHVHSVLYNVCGQLADTADILMERINTRTWKGVKMYAPRLMRRVSSVLTSKLKTPAIILLDSLDQLAPSDDAYSMDWLPTVLPQNIKIIVSTLPKEHGILEKLQKLLPDPSCYCAVPLMPETTGQEIVQKYLKLRKRTVTEAQLAVMLKAFSASPSPLYLKLLMDEAVKYPSFITPNPSSIPASIGLAISALFDELEIRFGRRLVQTALGLLTVGLNGLSDIEVEDALSCCDETLDEVYKFHDPPVPGIVRIPPVMWARIHYQLREYLVERLSQGKTTLFWYHRQFIETATERYTKGREGAKLHAVLFRMFCPEDGVKQSITLTNRKNLFVKDADRQTTPQPMTATNLRKLEAMTYHLLNAQGVVSVDEAKETVFTNFCFLSTKLSALGAEKVLADFTDFLQSHKDDELLCLKQFIESQKHSIVNPRSFAFSLIACLAPSPSFKYLEDLKKQAENFLTSSDKPQLIPCLPCLASRPGDPSLLLSGLARVVDQTGDCILLEKQSADEDVSSFSIVNVATSEVTDVILEPNVSNIKLTSDGQGFAYLAAGSVKCKKNALAKEVVKGITELFKGDKVVPKTTDSMRMSVSSDGSDIGLFHGALAAIVSGDLTKPTLQSISKLKDYSVQNLIPFDTASGLTIASGDISGGKGTHSFLALWKSESAKPEVVELGGMLTHSLVAVTPEEQFIVGPLTFKNNTHSIVVIKTNPFCAASPVPCGQVSQLRVSNSQQLVVILSDEVDVEFIDVSTCSKLEKITHTTAVVDFDVAWEEERVVVADKDGQISMYARSGKLLIAFLGHSQGLAYLKYLSESIIALTCSGLVKVWDAAAVASLMTSSAAVDPGDQKTADSESLTYLTDVINILFYKKGQELITFSPEGAVAAWAVDSQKKLRSFSIDIRADVIVHAAFSLAVALDKEKKSLKLFRLDTGDVVGSDVIPNNVIACTMTADRRCLLTLSEQPQLTLHRIQLEENCATVTKTLTVQLGFKHVTIDMKLTTLERYLCLQVKITEKDYEAIKASWKKGASLSSQRHPYRFAAIDLSSSTGLALHCFRPLTKVPHLGVGMEPYTGNTMLLASRRWLIFWDIPTGKCDQRLSKSARKTMFYRPDWVKASAGANISTCRSPCNKLLAVGSEDGYMFVYENESGMPVCMKAPSSKHQAPVSHLVITPDSSMVLSVCHNGVLKMWTASTATQVASLRLGSKIRCFQLTQDGAFLIAVTEAERSRVAVFKLHKGKP